MPSPYEQDLAEAIETGRYNLRHLAELKLRHEQEKDLEAAEKAVEKEITAARKKKAAEDTKRIDTAREQITPLVAELEEQRKAVAETSAALRAAQKAYNVAYAEAATTHQKMRDIAYELWRGRPIPCDDNGNPTADIYAPTGDVVMIDGEQISVLQTKAAN